MAVRSEAIAERKKKATFLARLALKIDVKSPTPSQWIITVLSIADLVQMAIRK